ncbi:putative membrane protein [Paraburkholderia sp. GAS199]|uniref:COG4648 family protein n=1 Tax=Paraburkholderia sp. GAS199 TaxID=3035126 RepID=UPI003D24F550
MPSARSRIQAAAAQPAVTQAGAERSWIKTVVQVLLKLTYPALILCAWRWDTPRYVGCMLFAILWLQRWAGSGPVATSLRRLSSIDWAVVGLLSCASAAIVATNSELLLRLYPSLVNLGLLIAFGATLVRGPSMIEKFARLGNPDLPPGAVRHTRRVTQVWCGFFVLNGIFSAYTALYWSRASWSLYNGAIAYGLIGLLLVVEVIWRYLVVLPRAARSEAA